MIPSDHEDTNDDDDDDDDDDGDDDDDDEIGVWRQEYVVVQLLCHYSAGMTLNLRIIPVLEQ